MKELISRYRSELMGIGIIWIIIHHIYFFKLYDFSNVGEIINGIARAGSCGVDIFLFLSGFGLYHSYSKNPNLKTFYLKRITRILPVFILCSVLWNGIKTNFTFRDLFFLKFWGNQFHWYWYITCILLFYALSPFIFKMLKRIGPLRVFLISCVVAFILSLLFTCIGLGDIHDIYVSIPERLPIFVAGIILAEGHFPERFVQKYYLLILAVSITALSILFFYNWDTWVYPAYFFLTLGLLPLFTSIFRFCPPVILRFLRFSGKLSLELYLIHMFIFWSNLFHFLNNIFLSVLSLFLLSYLGSWLINRFLSYAVYPYLQPGKKQNITR